MHRIVLTTLLLFFITSANSNSTFSSIRHIFQNGNAVLELGNYWNNQGEAQHINIYELIGNDYTVNKKNSSNALLGVGYFISGMDNERFNLDFGINWFYLPKTSISGIIVQEGLFENLAYRYSVTHYPIYFMAQSIVPTSFQELSLTIDAGIGPNIIKTYDYFETPLDRITIPDNAFSSKTTTKFSVTAGAGFHFYTIGNRLDLGIGYRFFYLGKGLLNKNNDQIINSLSTGNIYANAIVFSVTI